MAFLETKDGHINSLYIIRLWRVGADAVEVEFSVGNATMRTTATNKAVDTFRSALSLGHAI
jgi:hypothetical protein